MVMKFELIVGVNMVNSVISYRSLLGNPSVDNMDITQETDMLQFCLFHGPWSLIVCRDEESPLVTNLHK